MEVLKNNRTYPFDRNKIRNAIIQAYNQVCMPDFDEVDELVCEVEDTVFADYEKEQLVPVEEIENMVMSSLYRELPVVARRYSEYKINREKSQKDPSEVDKVLNNNKDVTLENANKNAYLTHIKNAYLAEIPSRQKFFAEFPEDCVKAHNKGVVYAHDSGYSIRSMNNCELLNLDYLLQNGCEINNTWVNKPHSFRTACTVATQILSHVTSNTYGLKKLPY